MLDKRTIKKGNHAVVQWLIHWSGSNPEDATWVDVVSIEQQFPSFDPWGKGSSQGRVLMHHQLLRWIILS